MGIVGGVVYSGESLYSLLVSARREHGTRLKAIIVDRAQAVQLGRWVVSAMGPGASGQVLSADLQYSVSLRGGPTISPVGYLGLLADVPVFYRDSGEPPVILVRDIGALVWEDRETQAAITVGV